MPYPKAGEANAEVALALVGCDGSSIASSGRATSSSTCAMRCGRRRARPTLVVQTRDQRTLAVLDVDPVSGAVRELHRQTDPHWVELVPGAPAWVGDSLLTVVDRDGARRACLDGEPITPADVQVRRVLHVADDAVYVAATDEPTEVHVARCGLDGTFTWLTYEPGVHSAVFGGDVSVVSSAGLSHPGAKVRVHRGAVELAHVESHAERPLVDVDVQIVSVGERELRVAVVLPKGVPADVKLPVLLDPYGGPHALRVQKSYNAFATSQWFADQGFAVIVCDGRGTPGRGPAWERAVRGDLAGPVLEDQVTALTEVADRFGGLDLTRVGIRGWSFGGYLAALAVLRRPDVFHAAVAGRAGHRVGALRHALHRALPRPPAERARELRTLRSHPARVAARAAAAAGARPRRRQRGRGAHAAVVAGAPRSGAQPSGGAAVGRHAHDPPGDRRREPPRARGRLLPRGAPHRRARAGVPLEADAAAARRLHVTDPPGRARFGVSRRRRGSPRR